VRVALVVCKDMRDAFERAMNMHRAVGGLDERSGQPFNANVTLADGLTVQFRPHTEDLAGHFASAFRYEWIDILTPVSGRMLKYYECRLGSIRGIDGTLRHV
jgi:hypothetical protein